MCPDCVSGTLNSESPTGSEATVHGLPTNVAHPDGQPKGLIVIVSDAFGMKFVNGKLLADQQDKKEGYLVYIPECINGEWKELDA